MISIEAVVDGEKVFGFYGNKNVLVKDDAATLEGVRGALGEALEFVNHWSEKKHTPLSSPCISSKG